MITLPLREIRTAASYDKTSLPVVTSELCQDWLDHYDQTAWSDYHDDNHRRIMLPELGGPGFARHYRSLSGVIIPIKSRRFKLQLTYSDWDEPWEAAGKSLILEQTEEPETPYSSHSVWPLPGDRPGTIIRRCSSSFCFGQPRWIQGEHYPADLHGRPCYHLLTDENGWGDSGNVNILVGLDLNDMPEVAYHEASCC